MPCYNRLLRQRVGRQPPERFHGQPIHPDSLGSRRTASSASDSASEIFSFRTNAKTLCCNTQTWLFFAFTKLASSKSLLQANSLRSASPSCPQSLICFWVAETAAPICDIKARAINIVKSASGSPSNRIHGKLSTGRSASAPLDGPTALHSLMAERLPVPPLLSGHGVHSRQRSNEGIGDLLWHVFFRMRSRLLVQPRPAYVGLWHQIPSQRTDRH